MKQRAYCFNNLLIAVDYYFHVCRVLRNVYKWSPLVCDEISLTRLEQIYDETIEDNTKENV